MKSLSPFMIYHSIHGLSNKIIAGRFLYTNSPAIIILLISEPLLSLFAYGFGACVIHAFRRRCSKEIFFKLELLPNTEQIVYQKNIFFGGISTYKVKISDMGFGETEQSEGNYACVLRGYINCYSSFSFKNEKEVVKLFFDKNGIWHQEGLSHQILV